LQPGDSSSLLVFTSPFAPEFDFLQVNSGLAGPAVSPLAASPGGRLFIPEPASVTIALACSAAVWGGAGEGRRRSSRRAARGGAGPLSEAATRGVFLASRDPSYR
jgi:hypothetical protein